MMVILFRSKLTHAAGDDYKRMETLRVWATDARHRVAQSTGRQKWYEYYKMDVAQIVRVSNFERPPSIAGARAERGT